MQPIFIVIFTVIFLYFLNQENNTIEHYKNKKDIVEVLAEDLVDVVNGVVWKQGNIEKFRNLIKQRYHLDDYIAKIIMVLL